MNIKTSNYQSNRHIDLKEGTTLYLSQVLRHKLAHNQGAAIIDVQPVRMLLLGYGQARLDEGATGGERLLKLPPGGFSAVWRQLKFTWRRCSRITPAGYRQRM